MLRAKAAAVTGGGRNQFWRLRLVAVALLLASSIIGLAACGSSGSSSSSESTSEQNATESNGGSETTAAAGGGSIAGKTVAVVSAPSSENPWTGVFNETIEKELGDKGVEVSVTGSLDPATQVQFLNQAVAENPDLIILEALDSKAVAPAIAKAKAQGVPVLNADGKADPSVEDGLNQVLSDNVSLGEFAAENIVEGLEAEGKKSGNIGVITGTASMLLTQERMEGFNKVLSEHPQYKIVFEQDGNWEPVKAGEIATQMFAKYGADGLQGAYGMADYMAVPIVTAAKQAGVPLGVKNDGLIISGGNCFKIGIEAIEKGEMYGTATEDPGTLAKQASAYAAKMLAGEEVPLTETVEEARVDPSSLSKYKAQCSKA